MKFRPLFMLMALLAALLVSSLMGCAQKEVRYSRPVETVSPAQEALEARERLNDAEAAFREGRLAEADRIFTDFLRRFPDQPGQDLAWLRHGQIQLRTGFPEGAIQGLEEVIRTRPPSPYLVEARLSLAAVQTAMRRPQSALGVLAYLRPTELTPSQKAEYYHQLGRTRFGLEQPKAALVAAATSYTLADPGLRRVLEDDLTRMVRTWSKRTLLDLARLYNSAYPLAWILTGLADLSAAEGDWKSARGYSRRLSALFPDLVGEDRELAEPRTEAAGETDPEDAPREEPTESRPEDGPNLRSKVWTIGCLLPESGPLAEYGRQLLNGIQLALDSFEEGSRFSLLIEDTANDPQETVEALTRLAAQPETVAVIGPLSGRLASAAALKADELKVPLITLTQRTGLAEQSPWVFRNFITPGVLLQALADWTVQKLALTRVAVLRPNSTYGLKMTELMTQALEANGAGVVQEAVYEPGAPDLAEQMVALGGKPPGEPPRQEPLPYEALFLPDDFRTVAQVAPQLIFYDLSGFFLLGTNLWHDPALIELAGPYVQGSILPTVFFPDSPLSQVRDFTLRYESTYGEKPELFAALGYDAARLTAETLWGGSVESRDQLRESLSQVSDYPGVTGRTTINLKGEAVKSPFLISVEGNNFVPAPSSPLPAPTPGQMVE